MSEPAFHTFPAAGEVTLRLALRSADVSVSTWDNERVEVEIEARRADDVAALVTVAGQVLGDRNVITIEESKRRSGFGRDPGLQIRVRSPHGSSVDCTSGSSDLHADGDLGDLVVKTGSGDVGVGHIRGSAKITGASGDVSIASAVGPITVSTASGDVSIGPAGSHVAVNAVSGDTVVQTANGGVSITTVSGDVEIGALVSGNAKVQSVSGDVELGVASGLAVWIDAQSVSGDITCGLEAEDAPPDDESSVSELRIRTVSGDVQIGRAPVVAVSPS